MEGSEQTSPKLVVVDSDLDFSLERCKFYGAQNAGEPTVEESWHVHSPNRIFGRSKWQQSNNPTHIVSMEIIIRARMAIIDQGSQH